jgi:hypothetical protein
MDVGPACFEITGTQTFSASAERLGASHRGMRRYFGSDFRRRRFGGEQIPGFKRGDFELPASV